MPYLYIYPIPPKSSRIKFTGYIVPKILEISLAVPRTGWTWPEVGIDVTFELSIVNGDISVICYASDFDKEKLFFPLILRTHDIVRTALNLTTFSSGFGFTFILDEATFPDGTKNKLMIQEPALATLSTSTEKQVDYDTVMKIALQELPVARALQIGRAHV